MKIAQKIAVTLCLIGGMAALHADNPTTSDVSGRAAQLRQLIQDDYRYVLMLQAHARHEKDVIKLNCVNDKLILMKAELNVADTMEPPVLAQLQQATDTVHNLRQEAAACVGEIELSKQESGATFSHPNFLDDPTDLPFGVYVEPPVYASPFD